jgi:hypothetical protein
MANYNKDKPDSRWIYNNMEFYRYKGFLFHRNLDSKDWHGMYFKYTSRKKSLLLHREIWREAGNDIPDGFVLGFKDGDPQVMLH